MRYNSGSCLSSSPASCVALPGPGHADKPIAANAQASIAFGIAFRAGQKVIDYVNEKGDGYRESSMQKHGILPVPAVFAIGQDGVIRYAYANANYKERLPAKDLMTVARETATD